MIDQFQEHQKDNTRSNFTEHKLSNNLGMERDPLLLSKQKLTSPTRTTPKRVKSPSKQPLHKSLIRPPKNIKDRLKNLSPIRPEQLKQKFQAPISQTAKVEINTKVNKENKEAHSKCTQQQSRL